MQRQAGEGQRGHAAKRSTCLSDDVVMAPRHAGLHEGIHLGIRGDPQLLLAPPQLAQHACPVYASSSRDMQHGSFIAEIREVPRSAVRLDYGAWLQVGAATAHAMHMSEICQYLLASTDLCTVPAM